MTFTLNTETNIFTWYFDYQATIKRFRCSQCWWDFLLPKGHTLTGQYCTTLLWQLNGTVLYHFAVATQRDSTVPPCCGNSTGQYCTTLLWQLNGTVLYHLAVASGRRCHCQVPQKVNQGGAVSSGQCPFTQISCRRDSTLQQRLWTYWSKALLRM